MLPRLQVCALAASLLASCAAEAAHRPVPFEFEPTPVIHGSGGSSTGEGVQSSRWHASSMEEPRKWRPSSELPLWNRNQLLLQGYFGAGVYDRIQLDGDSTIDDDATAPLFGGGALWKLAGERVDIGLEAMFNWGGNAEVVAFSSTGAGLVVAVDANVTVFELYGGPFISMFIDRRLRLYASAGPQMEWVEYNEFDPDLDTDVESTAFGVGGYARAGIELLLDTGTLIGIGVRRSQATVDLPDGRGELDLEGTQYLFTVTQGL